MQQVMILTAWTLTVAVLGFYAGRASLAQEISALRRQRYVLSRRMYAKENRR
jgi:hypothetical protein